MSNREESSCCPPLIAGYVADKCNECHATKQCNYVTLQDCIASDDITYT